jgi:hypothetical protein
MAMIDENQEKLNQDKYGAKDDDVIARCYRESQDIGDVWCAKNVERYLRRFLSKSHKGHNRMDLLKAKDYLDRMIENNPDKGQTEIIEK